MELHGLILQCSVLTKYKEIGMKEKINDKKELYKKFGYQLFIQRKKHK